MICAESQSNEKETITECKIKQLDLLSRNISVTVRVLSKNPIIETLSRDNSSSQRVMEALVGDETGNILMTLRDDDIERVNLGDMLTIKNGYISLLNGSMHLNTEKLGSLESVSPKIKPKIKIENVVATLGLGHCIDLESIVKNFPTAEYRPEQFPGLVFRLKKPKTATLIFHSGKMVCTGARSESQAAKALVKVIDQLKENGIIINCKPEVKIQNIVASADLYGTIDIEKVAYSFDKTVYEPEQFPGLIYRMADPKVVILIFATGKLVCTGGKKEKEVYIAVYNLQAKLEKAGLLYYK